MNTFTCFTLADNNNKGLCVICFCKIKINLTDIIHDCLESDFKAKQTIQMNWT